MKEDKTTTYKETHRERFSYCTKKIDNKIEVGSKVVDLGSHFLDQACMMEAKGYEVTGLDVPEFTKDKKVVQKAEENGIDLITIIDLEKGSFERKIRDNSFDALVMTEVIEHLAFNPLKMWQELIRILKPESKIFISTPNSMRLENMVREIARIITMKGVGESVKGIMETVTYGHHWKEYSPKEIYDYFKYIGIERDKIEIEFYSYRGSYETERIDRRIGNILKKIGNMTRKMSEEMFITVKLPKEKPKVPSPPSYGQEYG